MIRTKMEIVCLRLGLLIRGKLLQNSSIGAVLQSGLKTERQTFESGLIYNLQYLTSKIVNKPLLNFFFISVIFEKFSSTRFLRCDQQWKTWYQ